MSCTQGGGMCVMPQVHRRKPRYSFNSGVQLLGLKLDLNVHAQFMY